MPVTLEKINPDIAKERAGANFDVEEFAAFWHGGAEQLKKKREIEKILFDDENFKDEVPIEDLSYQDAYNCTIKKCFVLAKKLRTLQNERDPNGSDIYPGLLTSTDITCANFVPLGNPLMLQFTMFIPTINNQGTPEQIQKWIPKALNLEIIGTYAQTELGHGTFLRGLETRADFDCDTDEFVLHSSTITAYKWWPGGLGHTVNHAVVTAQLYIDNNPHGIQMFVVPLRDQKTHMPFPGIIIGEIGNKMAFQTVNNGYLGFEKFRIPRTNMLMKNAKVQRDGSFIKSPASVLTYLTMVQIRVKMLTSSSLFLTRAATIAIRYSAVRRQSKINPKEPEHQIMDHLTQQMKMFPQLAKSFVMKLSADYLASILIDIQRELLKGDLSSLPEMHALASCLKSISTKYAATGVETLRLACGGHGYMLASGLPLLYNCTSAAITYEGENTVMLLQTARYLMKSWAIALKGEKLMPTVMYLSEAIKLKEFPEWDGSWKCMVTALQFVAANKIRIAFNNLEARKKKNMVPEEAFNLTSIELAAAAEMHGLAFLANTALDQILSIKVSEAIKSILNDLVDLYLVGVCLEKMSDILRFIPQVTEKDIANLQVRLEESLKRLRPNAVAIVDGFDFHDGVLRSVLGSFDGNAYERIFASAQKNPMNKVPIQKSFEETMKPFMRSHM